MIQEGNGGNSSSGGMQGGEIKVSDIERQIQRYAERNKQENAVVEGMNRKV
jgi:hypothetical protein